MHYNQVVHPCVEALNSDRCDRSKHGAEIDNALAYRNWVEAQYGNIAAAPAFVAFHNLVTSSIDTKWLQGQQQHFHCIKEVAQAVPSKYVGDIAAYDVGRTGCTGTSVDGVPGLAPNSNIISCP